MINDLLPKQLELMKKVPHDVRPDAFVKMAASVVIIEKLLLFLNSCGHKPWRPDPLAPQVQQKRLLELLDKTRLLSYTHSTNFGADLDMSKIKEYSRTVVSALGVIEETVEYLESVNRSDDRKHQLEEITDVLFFYLEMVIQGEFSLEEIEEEYHRKWAVNMKRYEDAKKGDFSWDKREEGKL